MKKIVSLLLALMMACMLIPVCAEVAAETVTGDWYVIEMTQGETNINPGAMGMEITLVLNEDGTMALTMSMMGESQVTEGTWEIVDGKVALTSEDSTVELTMQEDGTLIGEDEGAVMVFSRESAAVEAVEFAEVNPDAQPEDFNGEWSFAYLSMAGITFAADTAVSAGLFEELPTLSIQDGHVTLGGGSSMEMMFGADGMDLEFADGGYGVSADLGEASMGIYVKMLQDGMVYISIDMGQEIALYFTKAE